MLIFNHFALFLFPVFQTHQSLLLLFNRNPCCERSESLSLISPQFFACWSCLISLIVRAPTIFALVLVKQSIIYNVGYAIQTFSNDLFDMLCQLCYK